MARLEGLLYAATMQTNLLNHFGAPLGGVGRLVPSIGQAIGKGGLRKVVIRATSDIPLWRKHRPTSTRSKTGR